MSAIVILGAGVRGGGKCPRFTLRHPTGRTAGRRKVDHGPFDVLPRANRDPSIADQLYTQPYVNCPTAKLL